MKTTKQTPPHATEQGQQAGNTSQPLTRATHRKPRLTLKDAEAVAALCAKRASEKEACAFLAIPYSTWAHYKSKNRNAEAFSKVVDSIRAAKIQAHLSNIESFSAKDWRASECYLEKTIPDRFSNRAAENSAPVVVAIDEAKRRRLQAVYDALVVDCPPPAAMLPAPARVLEIEPAKEQ